MTTSKEFCIFLAHLSYVMARRPSVRPSTFHIFNFFWRSAEGIYSKLATNVPYGARPSIVTFYVDMKSSMAVLASDWLTHFQLLK